MSFNEKRVSPRRSINHPVKYKTDVTTEWKIAFLIDQSESGILLASQTDLAVGSIIQVMMDEDTSWQGDHCQLVCKVIRVVAQPEDAILKFDLGCTIEERKSPDT